MNNDIITLDNDIFINGHLVLRINYDTNINNIPIDNILKNIANTMTKASKEIAEKNTYILLLDFNKVKKKYIHLDKIKKILKFVQSDYPDKLEKCIVYNYTKFWKFLMTVILSILDPVTKKKIKFIKTLDI